MLLLFQIAETTKEAIKATATSCMEKLQGTSAVKNVNKQVENAISLSELMVEICFPTDGADPNDLAELEREEAAEHEGAAVRVANLTEKVKQRGRKRIMALKPVQVTVDAVSTNIFICVTIFCAKFDILTDIVKHPNPNKNLILISCLMHSRQTFLLLYQATNTSTS